MQGAVVTFRRRDESGAVLMIVVISLVVLLGMAALVVDLGGGYSQRRKMQSAADAAAVGAAQNLTGREHVGAAGQAATIGNKNLPKLTPNWNGCARRHAPDKRASWRTRAELHLVQQPTRCAFASACRADVPDPVREDPRASRTQDQHRRDRGTARSREIGGGLVPFAVGG